jgi:signal transduction histidine kinase
VLAVRLIGPGGVPLLERGEEDDVPGAVREVVALAAPLDGLHVEAISLAPTGLSGLVIALAAAALFTTLALVAGAVSLQRAAEAHARLAEDRKRFLDHVAHEIRTPATALLTLSEELASGQVKAEREPLYRKHLVTEARRLAELVDDTLDLTRLEAGRLAFRREPSDLVAVAKQALVAARARGRGRPGGPPEFRATLPKAPVSASLDRTAVARTIRNLLDNAWQHGGGDGRVELELTCAGGVARIVVHDHGRGIAAEHLPHLFKRFYRVPGATHEGKGVGLGLSLCREVARAHGGDVAVASTPGSGTTFTLTLPLEDAHAV